MIRTELNLARQVKDDVIDPQLEQFNLEPIQVGFQVLQAVQHAAVRSQLEFGHDFVERDQVRDGDVRFVRRVRACWIQVDDGNGSRESGEELLQLASLSSFLYR